MNTTLLILAEATIFPDYNKTHNLAPEHTLSEISLGRLKYKHFRDIAQYPQQDQMHHLMLILTDLSEEDLGELSPDDAAEIAKLIFVSMQKYIQLGQNMIGTLNSN